MNQDKTSPTDKVSLICGTIGLLGCLSAIISDIIGIIVVEKHDPICFTLKVKLTA